MRYGSAGYVLTALADFLMPRECLVCGRELLVHEKHICTPCLEEMPLTYFWKDADNPMGKKFNALVQRENEQSGGAVYEQYSYAAALFHYRTGTGYEELTKALKYHSDMAAGRFFAAMLGRRIASSPLFCDVSAVVPVPLHWTRSLSRGYNQAEVIAREVASCIGVPVYPRLLRRNRRTRTQTHMSGEDKVSNVKGAFTADTKALSGIAGQGVHVLIVDDVFTSGSTLLSCRKAVCSALDALGVKHGDVRISVATLGYVGGL